MEAVEKEEVVERMEVVGKKGGGRGGGAGINIHHTITGLI